MRHDVKFSLSIDDIPKRWYNIAADSPVPLPPPHNPATNEPMDPKALEAIFPRNLIEQEISQERYIDIPEEVRDAYVMLNRPSPLVRAVRLEKALKTPAKIYYKREDLSPCGSHKPNTAVPQAYYNMKAGTEHITTETGAGQWGMALSLACSMFDMSCKVFMTCSSYDSKPYRRIAMETYGAKVYSSPSGETKYGREIKAKFPDTPGSLGIAISEAIEAAVTDPTGKTRYSLGSVLNHVLLHQTIIGLEAKKQMQMAGEKLPDVIIGCAGGGSNFAGLAFPYTTDKINGANIEIIPVEPAACPTMTRAPFSYDHGDTAGMTPLLAMHSLGHAFVPPPIHAGGLRYHGMAPLVCQCIVEGLFTPRAYPQSKCYESALTWAKTEGTICAPETSHAIADS